MTPLRLAVAALILAVGVSSDAAAASKLDANFLLKVDSKLKMTMEFTSHSQSDQMIHDSDLTVLVLNDNMEEDASIVKHLQRSDTHMIPAMKSHSFEVACTIDAAKLEPAKEYLAVGIVHGHVSSIRFNSKGSISKPDDLDVRGISVAVDAKSLDVTATFQLNSQKTQTFQSNEYRWFVWNEEGTIKMPLVTQPVLRAITLPEMMGSVSDVVGHLDRPKLNPGESYRVLLVVRNLAAVAEDVKP
jgi:hypothetical protein